MSGGGDLVSTNNLSDLTNFGNARTNLGLGTAAQANTADFATSAQGLLAANALIKSNNLSDLSNTTIARNNLGLGTAAVANTADFATSAQGTLATNAVPKSLYSARGAIVIGNATSTAITLLAGTNGQLLYANSSADAGATWVTPNYETAGAAAAAQAASQPIDADLTSIAALTTTAYGRSLLTGLDAANTRTTLLGLGTAATTNSTAYDAAGSAAAAQAASQPVDSDLTAIAALTTTAYGRSLLTGVDAANTRTTLLGLGTAALSASTDFATSAQGTLATNAVPTSLYSAKGALVIGNATSVPTTFATSATNGQLLYSNSASDVGVTWVTPNYETAGAAAAAQAASQPLDADLTAIAALATQSYGRSLLTSVDAAAARSTLVLGTAASNAATDFATSTQGSTADNAVPKSLFGGKGVLIAGTSTASTPANIAIGADGLFLVANSSATAGISWAAPTFSAQVIKADTTTAYTVILTDVDKFVTFDNTSAITCTLVSDAVVNFPIGIVIDFMQMNIGQVTWTAGANTIIRTSGITNKARAQYARVAAQKISANTWSLYGDLASS